MRSTPLCPMTTAHLRRILRGEIRTGRSMMTSSAGLHDINR